MLLLPTPNTPASIDLSSSPVSAIISLFSCPLSNRRQSHLHVYLLLYIFTLKAGEKGKDFLLISSFILRSGATAVRASNKVQLLSIFSFSSFFPLHHLALFRLLKACEKKGISSWGEGGKGISIK